MSKSFERTIRGEWKETGVIMRVRHTAALFKLWRHWHWSHHDIKISPNCARQSEQAKTA
jgi:hypothetical protein